MGIGVGGWGQGLDDCLDDAAAVLLHGPTTSSDICGGVGQVADHGELGGLVGWGGREWKGRTRKGVQPDAAE